MKNSQLLREDILRIKKDFEAEGMNLPPGLAGIYGELLAFEKLRDLLGEEAVEYDPGQTRRADIWLEKNKKKLFIEIKTSRLKDEGFGWWYGAALDVKTCQKHLDTTFNHRKKGVVRGDFCYFDFVVFIKLDENFNAEFFIIPRDFIEKNQKLLINNHPRFLSSSHRILVSNGGKMPDKLEEKYHPVIRATEAYKDRWGLITDVFMN